MDIISLLGSPLALQKYLQYFNRRWIPVTESGCWIWTEGCDKDGYGKVQIQKKSLRAHRCAWMLFRGDLPDDLCVLHRCDVPSCVNPDHLFLGTNQDNTADRVRKGRGAILPIHRETKLTDEDVMTIRALRGVMRQVDLGKQFGLHHSQISRIQRGLSFGHLSVPER
jgi:hypothetical protein